MIILLKDTSMVEMILPLIEKIEGLPHGVEEYYRYISEHLEHEAALLLVDLDDNAQAQGFLYAETAISVSKIIVLVYLAYMNPKDRKVGKEMMMYTERWGLLRDAKSLRVLCPERQAQVYRRRYGFKDAYICLDKEIEVNRGRPAITDDIQQSTVSVL